MMSKKWQSQKGFTLIEAIMVVVIIGILASTLIYKFTLTPGNEVTGAADQLIADIYYVQMKAMGTGRSQSIQFFMGESGYTLPEEQKKRLANSVIFTNTTLPGSRLTFNSLGEPVGFGNNDHTITLAGTRIVTIYNLTGKAE
jgi:prepilin-type N-terminal cleavage/methylation domain-containing protein